MAIVRPGGGKRCLPVRDPRARRFRRVRRMRRTGRHSAGYTSRRICRIRPGGSKTGTEEDGMLVRAAYKLSAG